MRFLADDAGIDFVAMPEKGNDGAKLITFSLRKSPFSALETKAKMNWVTLVYEDEIWHMRPLSDKSLIARTTELDSTQGKLITPQEIRFLVSLQIVTELHSMAPQLVIVDQVTLVEKT